MITERAARILRLGEYGIAPGHPADLVVLDAETPEAAVATVASPLWGLKRGRPTFARSPVRLL